MPDQSSLSSEVKSVYFPMPANWNLLQSGSRPSRPLTEADAIDIWIARWLRIRRKDLIQRYGCDPRRLYEIWGEERFAGSRDKALNAFRERFPSLVDRIDPGAHTRISRAPHPAQLGLFD
jgi:hypothetical protein